MIHHLTIRFQFLCFDVGAINASSAIFFMKYDNNDVPSSLMDISSSLMDTITITPHPKPSKNPVIKLSPFNRVSAFLFEPVALNPLEDMFCDIDITE